MQLQQLTEVDQTLISKLRLIASKTRYNILRIVYNSKKELNISEIANILQMTPASISYEVKKLEQQNLIISKYKSIKNKHGVSKFIHINKDDEVIKLLLPKLKIND